jgi:hypothetical protein
VFWYFPIIPRLKRWFANKKESELLRWHKEKHKQDVAKKVFWYFPIIPHLKRWFANKNESELLRWHKDKHKQDVGMIRHPADATQWRNIDSRNPEFAIDPRNIRTTTSTDGMNPFMNNSTHST